MPEDNLHTLKYRILRYMPNLVRDEWVNIGVMLEDAAASGARCGRSKNQPSSRA